MSDAAPLDPALQETKPAREQPPLRPELDGQGGAQRPAGRTPTSSGAWVLRALVATAVLGFGLAYWMLPHRGLSPQVSSPEAPSTGAPKPASSLPPPPIAELPRRPSGRALRPDLEADRGIDEVAALRSAGRFADAAKLLSALVEQPFSEGRLELMSFELATILEQHLHEQRAACIRYRSHQERFPDGRYRAEVAQALERLRCEP